MAWDNSCELSLYRDQGRKNPIVVSGYASTLEILCQVIERRCPGVRVDTQSKGIKFTESERQLGIVAVALILMVTLPTLLVWMIRLMSL